MTAETFDTVVIGAGVAGAAFASLIAHPSRRVLLVERSAWPRTKVCGCCLNSAATELLERLGVGESLSAAAKIDSVRLIARGRSARLNMVGGRGVAVSRFVLDNLLVQRVVQAGVDFRPCVAASVTNPTPCGGWSVRLRTADGEHTVRAALVVAADGLGGSSLNNLPAFEPTVSPRAWFGVGGTFVTSSAESCQSGEIAMHIGAHGYAGLVRLDPQTINLAAALDPVWTRRIGGPAQAVTAIIREAGGGAGVDLTNVQLRGTGLLTRRRPRASAPGLLVIGDAAGYIEPFTGEGMAWGLAGAEVAAGMVNAGLSGQPLADAWADWHAAHLRSRQRTCVLVRELLRRPRLVGCVLSAINTTPAAARAATALARRIERPYVNPAPEGVA